jgi:hypothetical protein
VPIRTLWEVRHSKRESKGHAKREPGTLVLSVLPTQNESRRISFRVLDLLKKRVKWPRECPLEMRVVALDTRALTLDALGT